LARGGWVTLRVDGMQPELTRSDCTDGLSAVRSEDQEPSPSAPNSTQQTKWLRWAAFLLVALLGLTLRLPQLGERPMHTDEAVNAYIVGQLLAGQPFIYDPHDRHGPLLAALALPLVRVQGAKTFSDLTEAQLRMTSVLAGSVTILLFAAGVEMYGFLPCLIAALLFAFAPLPVYYDRYFIHESLFVAATFGLMLSGWHALERRSLSYSSLAGVCAALMLASKETAVLHFVGLAVAAFIYWLWNLLGKAPAGWWQPKATLLAAAVFLLLTVTLFTWFGRNWNALPMLLQAVPNFLQRAHGEGHEAPSWYYLRLVTGGWSGPLMFFLACIGFFQPVKRRVPSPFAFLALYVAFIAIIYSSIPYKTPWLTLNLWLPATLLVGLALEWIWRVTAKYAALRIVCALMGALAVISIFHDTRQRVFVDPTGEANPYAYAHTSEDLLGLPTEIDRLARQSSIASPRIAVIAADPWPLPWYLRHDAEVGFWQPDHPPGPQPGDADFYITSTESADQYAELLKDLRPQFFGVRPGVLILLWSPAPK